MKLNTQLIKVTPMGARYNTTWGQSLRERLELTPESKKNNISDYWEDMELGLRNNGRVDVPSRYTDVAVLELAENPRVGLSLNTDIWVQVGNEVLRYTWGEILQLLFDIYPMAPYVETVESQLWDGRVITLYHPNVYPKNFYIYL